MSAALITQLRESVEYLRDDGYHQTAQLVALAADEIERLHRERQLLDATGHPDVRRPAGIARRLGQAASREGRG
jgi:hypothetical protein